RRPPLEEAPEQLSASAVEGAVRRGSTEREDATLRRPLAAVRTVLDVGVTAEGKPVGGVAGRVSRGALPAGQGSVGGGVAVPGQVTNAGGRASVDLPPGTFWVSARTAHAVIDLAGEPRRLLELSLEAGSTLAGRVLEAGSLRPIAGALVAVRPSEEGGGLDG